MSLAPPLPTAERSLTASADEGSCRAVVARMVRTALLAGGAASAVACGGVLVVSGTQAAMAALVGALLSVGAFWTGTLAISAVLSGPAQTVLVNALAVYVVHIGVLVALVLWLRTWPWLDGTAVTAGLLLAGLAYQVGQVVGFLRARTLLVTPADDGPHSGARR